MTFSLFSLLHCFGQRERYGAVKLDNDTKLGCVFCSISQGRGFDIVLENSQLVVFRDRDPSAKEHLLVVPVKHIPSVKALRREDVPLLKDMEYMGHYVLDSLGVDPQSRRLGFHIPPFNSVMHLHLHVHGLPYKSLYRRAKYPISAGGPGRKKGISWFVEISQAVSILEEGGKIGVFPR